MNRYRWLFIAGLAACHSGAPTRRAASKHPVDTAFASMMRDRKDRFHDRALMTPRVITMPTVVVFWLHGSDTLSQDSADAALSDLGYATEQVARVLSENDVALVPTNMDTVYVELPGAARRAIVLSGLDYPFGYLLIDPGTPERILTGTYDDGDLLDELDAYFDLSTDSDSGSVAPRVIT